MNTKLIEAARLALEALLKKMSCDDDCKCSGQQAITAIKEALAQPEQEPVAWVILDRWKTGTEWPDDCFSGLPIDGWTPLYTTPPPCPTCEALARTVMLDQTYHDNISPQRTWQGLMDEHPLMVFAKECVLGAYQESELADAAKRAIEAAHGIKGDA